MAKLTLPTSITIYHQAKNVFDTHRRFHSSPSIKYTFGMNLASDFHQGFLGQESLTPW